MTYLLEEAYEHGRSKELDVSIKNLVKGVLSDVVKVFSSASKLPEAGVSGKSGQATPLQLPFPTPQQLGAVLLLPIGKTEEDDEVEVFKEEDEVVEVF